MEIDSIISKINNKDAVVGIIGLGYVALPQPGRWLAGAIFVGGGLPQAPPG